MLGKKKKKLKSFETAYQEYYSDLVRYAYKMTSDYDEANDLCQEVFITFYNKIDQIDNVKNWLFSTLKFNIYNYYRKNKMNPLDIGEINDKDQPVYENKFADTKIILNDAIENSENFDNELEKKILDLIAFKGYSYVNAAEHLGLTVKITTYKYKKVMNKIAYQLKKAGINNIEALF